MIVTIEYIDGTPDERHEDVMWPVKSDATGRFLSVVHRDGSSTLVNIDTVRTVEIV